MSGYFFCCTWRSFWCVLDTLIHELAQRTGYEQLNWKLACDKHDELIWRRCER